MIQSKTTSAAAQLPAVSPSLRRTSGTVAALGGLVGVLGGIENYHGLGLAWIEPVPAARTLALLACALTVGLLAARRPSWARLAAAAALVSVVVAPMLGPSLPGPHPGAGDRLTIEPLAIEPLAIEPLAIELLAIGVLALAGLLYSFSRAAPTSRVFPAGVLAALVAGLAVIALFERAIGIAPADGWAAWFCMSLPVAFGLLAVSVSLYTLTLVEPIRSGRYSILGIEVPLALALMCAVLISAQMLQVRERTDIREVAEAEAAAVRDVALAHAEGLVLALLRMAERWATWEGTPHSLWASDAANYIEDHPALLAMAWVDATGAIRWVHPIEGHERLVGFDLGSSAVVRPAMDQARTLRQPAMTAPVDLLEDRRGLVVIVPIAGAESFDGYIVAGFHFDGWLTSVRENVGSPEGYHFAVYENDRLVFVHGEATEPTRDAWTVTGRIDVGQSPLRLEVWPAAARLDELQTRLPETILLGGLSLVALLVVALYGMRLYFWRTQQERSVSLALKQEVAQRTRAETELAAERQRLERILENAGEGIYGLDREGRTTFANPAACRMTGWSSEEMIGRAQHALIHHSHAAGSDYPRSDCPIFATLSDGRTRTVEDEVFWHRNGRPFPVEYTSTPVTDEAGRRTGAVVVFRDVTERREKERELRRRSAELAAANKDLEGFAYSVSHDLRAPLRSMDGFSQALVEDFGDRLDGDARDYLERIRAASQRMGRLIDGILALSRVARTDIAHETVDLSALAEETVADLRQAEPARSVVVHVHEGMDVQGDERLMRLAMENLIGNAWKFTAASDPARIEVGTRTEGGSTVYFVRDNGAGFDPRYVDKLFRPFQRLHLDREFEGTGIGLATVARIIHRHGGRVSADGEIGSGATIEFTFDPPKGEDQ